jgi:NADH-quinone oxidoreductase subunit A
MTLVVAILFITYIINTPQSDYQNRSPYECGFEPFGDARSFFDVQFYTVGLLFVIFDLEVVFLIPFVSDVAETSGFSYVNMVFFMAVVITGFYYEWAAGLLAWIPSKKFAVKQ